MCIRDRSSTIATALNLTNTVVGAGLLSIPFCVRAAGFFGVLIFATVTMLLGWALVGLLTGGAMAAPATVRTLAESGAEFADYPILARSAWGRRGEVTAILLMFCELWLGIISYLILIGLNFEATIPGTLPSWVVITGCGVAGAAMGMLHLNQLAMFSGLALCITAGSCIMMAVSGAMIPESHVTTAARQYEWINPAGLPEATGLIFFTFAGFPIFPKLYANMSQKAKFPGVVACSFGTIFALYVGLGVTGYLLFGRYTQESFTQNVGRLLNGEIVPSQKWMALFVGLGMSVNKLLTIPLVLIVVADGVMNVLGWVGTRRHQLVVVALATVQTLLALVLKDQFATFTSLVGSLASVTTSLLLPIGFYVALVLPHHKGTRLQWCREVSMLSCAGIFGIFCAAVGSLSAACALMGQTSGACSFTSGWRSP
eukprot:TRINITY_DN23745_c0_g1_i1.p1 TRINITY_DN23745_c0_g1~~TRINITY_DN23745_c0_g1_i1.p1  ORF type:complete len:428 (-),score=107.00 TRINITY_DN23745_c0_g1_i1:220-1503(-)